MTGCTHGMPSPGSCVDCMDEGNLPPAPRPEREGWPFVAQFESACTGPPCRGIEPGERIVLMDNGTYRHVGICERLR